MSGYLHLLEPAEGPARLDVAKTPFVIGRHPKADGRLDAPSISQRHARISLDGGTFVLEDLQSTNGTKGGGERVRDRAAPLVEGALVELGAVRLVWSTSPDRPGPAAATARAAAIVRAPRPRSLVAIAAIAGFLAAVPAAWFVSGLLVRPKKAAPPPSAPDRSDDPALPAPSLSGPASRAVDAAGELASAERELAGHRPDLARARLERLRAQVAGDSDRARVEDLLGRARTLAPAYVSLRRSLAALEAGGRTVAASLAGRSVDVGGADEDGVFTTGARETIPWRTLGAADLLALLAATGVDRSEPLGAAAYALAAGDEPSARVLLARFLEAEPGAREQAGRVWTLFSGRQPPAGGFGTPTSSDPVAPPGPGPEPAPQPAAQAGDPDAKAKELARLQSELGRLRELEEARRAAREGFDPYLASIDTYVLSLDFDQAILDLETLEADLARLGVEDLRAKVVGRLFDVRAASALFRRLVEDINAGRLARAPSWQTASRLYEDVKLAGATAEGVRVLLPQAEIELRWRFLDPDRLLGFFELLRLSIEDRFALGKICLDRGLESAAQHQWIQVVRSGSPALRQAIDRNLAERLGTPVPAGGFVVHGSALVHPDVKVNLEKGLVLFRGRWMTAEELAKARSGLVQYRGEWISKEEKTSLEALEREEGERARTEGFVREGGRWVYRHAKDVDGQTYLTVGGKFYPAEKARELRSEWANAWSLRTEHFDLRTNMSDDFATEWADFMEAAWDEYVRYFGVELDRRLELFAFRTYDDYRNYCQETGNQGNLKAGGFADPALGRGVGWKSGQGMESLFHTMIHEGAHLYHFYAFSTPVVPSWYAEGTATQFEGYRWDSSSRTLGVDYVSRSRLFPVKGAIQAGVGTKLSDLVRDSAGASIEAGPARAANYYAAAWAFKNFLDRSTDPVVRRMADEFKSEMEAGEFRNLKLRGAVAPGEDPLERVFGADLSWLQAKWEDYVRGIE